MKKTYILALSLSLITCQLYAADSNTASPEPVITYNASVANSIDNIAEKLREFQDKNPNASEAELNEYADSLLKTELVQTPGRSSRATISSVYTDMDGYINGYLNAQEQALYNANRAKGLLCIANAKTAKLSLKSKHVFFSELV